MKRTVYISHNEVDCALDAHGTLQAARAAIEAQMGEEEMKDCEWRGSGLFYTQNGHKVAYIYVRGVEFPEA